MTENAKSEAIVTDEAVQAALEADQGKDAKLDSWKIVPFTKKGDNYASFVTSISVNYLKGDKKESTSYVVKITPCRPSWGEGMPEDDLFFRKEGRFYLDLLPELNNLLSQSGHERLPFPKCYYAQYTKYKEMIIFEDLRQKGFKMADRKKGLDLQHALLVLKGLGSFHGASVLLQKNLSLDDIKSKYSFLFEEVWEGKIVEMTFVDSLETCTRILEKIGGYEKVIEWFNKVSPNLVDFFKNNLAINPPFSVICHGDCWNNNLVFRYNDSGVPVEAMLLDAQINKFASPATDLVHFLFSSLVGDVRKPNVDHLLTDYFTAFSSVIEGCGQGLPYTKEMLVKEYKNKYEYGLIFGSMMIPPVLLEGEDLPDMENVGPDNLEEFMVEYNKIVMNLLDKNPLFKPRFLSLFNEMIEEGLFS